MTFEIQHAELHHTEIHNPEQARYVLRLNASAIAAKDQDLDPLLEQLRNQTGADGAVIYRFDPGSGEFEAVAGQATTVPQIPELGITLGIQASAWLKRGREHVQCTLGTDARFGNFPEGLQFGFRRLLLAP